MSLAYRLAALVVVLTALVCGGVYIGHLRSELHTSQESTRKAQEALEQFQATLAYRERLRTATARKHASAAASVASAVQANKAWADTPVPKEVQDALCSVATCAGADGVRDSASDNNP